MDISITVTLPSRTALDAAALLAVLGSETSDEYSVEQAYRAILYLMATIGDAYKEGLEGSSLRSDEQRHFESLLALANQAI